MKPAACTAASPSAAWLTTRTQTSACAARPRRAKWLVSERKVGPSTNSMAMKHRPGSWPKS